MVEARVHAQRLRLRGPALHAAGSGIVRLAPRRHLRRDARAGAVAVRAVPARPAADPRSPAGSPDPHARHLRDHDARGDGRGPARLPDADLRLQRHLSRADDPRPHGPRGRGPPAQRAAVRGQRAPARRPRARGARRPSDGPDRRRRQLRVPLPERAGRGEPLVPRPRARRARRARCTTACWRCTCSRTTSSASSTCRAASTTCRS